MSATLGWLWAFLERIWPSGGSGDSRWVEPSSELTRMVLDGLAREQDEARAGAASYSQFDDAFDPSYARGPETPPSAGDAEPEPERRHGSAA